MRSTNLKYYAYMTLNGRDFTDFNIDYDGKIDMQCKHMQGKLVVKGNIVSLSFFNNKLETLKVEDCPELEWLDCSKNLLYLLKLNNPKLSQLYCSSNYLLRVDLKRSPLLRIVACTNNDLVSFYTFSNPELEVLNCSENSMFKLDFRKNNKLEQIDCVFNPKLEKIIVSKNNQIRIFKDDHTDITEV